MRKFGPWVLAVAAVLCAVIGWRVMRGAESAHAAQQPPAPQEIPVTTAAAQTRDVPVVLDGLGTVQALNVVEIKAQVNGNLVGLPVREGQEVHKGDIVAEIDPRPYKAALDLATAQRAEDAALLESAKQDLARYTDLAKRQFAPVQQVDDQRATVDKDAAAVAADEANMETAKINLDYCVIRSPIDGRVSLYQVNAGNLIEVSSQTGIVSITQDKPIDVVFTLPESELPQVQAALAKGTVPVVVSDSTGATQLAQGTLQTPNNTIDTTTGTIALKALFANKKDQLWPGQFVDARVQVNVLQGVVTVPELAIEHGPSGLFVYRVKPDSTVESVPVKVAYQNGGLAVVSSGLAAKDNVVVSGQSLLAPGSRVKPTDTSVAPPPSADSEANATSPT